MLYFDYQLNVLYVKSLLILYSEDLFCNKES